MRSEQRDLERASLTGGATSIASLEGLGWGKRMSHAPLQLNRNTVSSAILTLRVSDLRFHRRML